MNFRTIKASIINDVLGPAEGSNFQTVGFQRQVKSADETLDTLRMVQVYYSSGDFSKRGGRLNGPTQHDVTYRIDLTVSKAAEGDLAVINDPQSSAVAIATALAAFQEASELADDSFDQLVDLVYNILMDARNIDLGLDAGVIANRWIDNVQKDQPVPRGEYVILTGSMFLKLRTAEQVEGDPGLAGETIDTVIDIDGDDVEKTGVTVSLT
jgi:hypothetical protein